MTCDGCGKERRVVACGRDSNLAPDAPDLCFLCRVEGSRGKVWDQRQGRYVYSPDPFHSDLEA